jgi:hypothetical protein
MEIMQRRLQMESQTKGLKWNKKKKDEKEHKNEQK